MNKKAVNKLDDLADEVSALLKEDEASITLSKQKGTLDMEVAVKSTPFLAAFMASAIGHTNRKIAVAMITGLLCAIFKSNEDRVEEMEAIITGLGSVLSMEEIEIMEKSALAAYVMRKGIETSKAERFDVNDDQTISDFADYFGDIKTDTVQ